MISSAPEPDSSYKILIDVYPPDDEREESNLFEHLHVFGPLRVHFIPEEKWESKEWSSRGKGATFLNLCKSFIVQLFAFRPTVTPEEQDLK